MLASNNRPNLSFNFLSVKGISSSAFAWGLLLALYSLQCTNVEAQGGTWIWMNGSNTLNSLGNYGAKGIASASNSPPALANAVEWTDREGNFWLFGGANYIEGGTVVSDLWK